MICFVFKQFKMLSKKKIKMMSKMRVKESKQMGQTLRFGDCFDNLGSIQWNAAAAASQQLPLGYSTIKILGCQYNIKLYGNHLFTGIMITVVLVQILKGISVFIILVIYNMLWAKI